MPTIRSHACAILVFAVSLGLIAACQTTSESSDVKAKQAQFGAPKGGHYLGYLKAEGTTTKTPVSFELIPLDKQDLNTVYRAHLKLSVGSHGGHEYASYNFEDTTFSQIDKSIKFQTLNGMTAMALRFDNAQTAQGTIRTSTGQLAELIVIHEDNTNRTTIASQIWPELTSMSYLTGVYKGQCQVREDKKEDAILEVESVKTRGHSPDDAGELKGYRISARYGQTDSETCRGSAPCFQKFYSEGAFNIISGELTLKDGRQSIKCSKSSDQLTCGACNFQQEKSSAYALLLPDSAERKKAASIIRDTQRKFPTAQGQFYGYVHNARNNTYQLVAINIFENESAAMQTVPETTPVDGVVTLYFGEGDTNEYIAYRMKPSVLDNKDQRFFWDSEGEIVLKILTWKNDVMVGEWISKAYGRVGHFMVQKGHMPQMSETITTLPKISGTYRSPEWEFEIAAYSELSESSQEIYPLNSYGWAKERVPHSRRRIIKKIFFDFYTATIGLDLDDGRTIVGRVNGDKMDMLWWPRVNYGAPFSPIKVITFEKVSDTPTPQARVFKESGS